MTETKKDFHSSSSDRICMTDSITVKFETLGSNFSHEIRASEAAGVIATIIRKSFKNHYSSSPLSASG